MPHKILFIAEPSGHVRHLVDDTADTILGVLGDKVATWRNSHVETWSSLSPAARQLLLNENSRVRICGGKYLSDSLQDITNMFWADMTPVRGPILGPYGSLNAAIAAEKAWLETQHLPLTVTDGRN